MHNNFVEEYIGIPYAIPPLGDLRFKYPKPAPFRYCIINAAQKQQACMQEVIIPLNFQLPPLMSEDCLYLNVWVPICHMEKKPLTTMIWIHGGGFLTGSGSQGSGYQILSYGGTIASLGCVIVVSINYRLGAFGFLHLPNKNPPGNMGMMDQVLAMQWVNRNIAAFGGSSRKITIFGQSAGGMAIFNHMVSPLTKGLFSRVIIESFSRLSDNNLFTAIDSSENINISKMIVSSLGCNRISSEDTIVCMRSLQPREISLGTKSYYDSIPTIRGLLPELECPYLPKNDEIINAHDVDIMIGTVKDEESIYLSIFEPNILDEEHPTMNKSEARQIIKKYFRISDERANIIFDEYIAGIPDEDSFLIVKRTYQAMGDGRRICPSYFFAEVFSECQNVYHYTFDHRRFISESKKWVGVPHTEELYFVNGMPFRYPEFFTLQEATLSLNMIQLWTSFARIGKPYSQNVTYWPPFDGNRYSLNFKVENIRVQKDPLKEKCKFWRKFYGRNK